MPTVKAMAAELAGGELKPFEYETGALGPTEVEIKVESCGICHSDLSMLDNDWAQSVYPLVAGHEVSGTITAMGERVSHLRTGQKVGLGWYMGSCMTCGQCMSGDHNLCGSRKDLIVGNHGGFASSVRCDAAWAVPIPEGVDAADAGPLFCGGITVFNPIVQMGVKPTDRVGVVGIGGLGHLALQFLSKWGCEVTAFTSSESKMEEAKKLGAHKCVSSRDENAIAAVGEKESTALDFLMVTVNVPLDWDAYFAALGKRGRMHFVGAVLEPIPVGAFTLIGGQKEISGTPLGSPQTTATMLEFCGRHGIKPQTEHFPMSKANDAIQYLKDGKARYRIVLDQDLN
ncbi:MAG: NAD(P)-dependent alcohol dehydrogenase [Planctomycetota bacterium]